MERSNIQPLATHYQVIAQCRDILNQRILGQSALIDRLIIALLSDGHLLVEGAPGLAKTKAIKELASLIQADFSRMQFTPDLLPSDLTGSDVYRPDDGSFIFQPGPVFHNVVLADEVNRAPAKVQSALLEAMGERQVTVGRKTYLLPTLFMVMATQNPIEQEGTYPLPEAQLDRFLMYVKVDYPQADTEHAILALARAEENATTPSHQPKAMMSQEVILAARHQVTKVHLSPELEKYLIQIIMATRQPKRYGEQLQSWLRFGASPRATIALDRCARAHAWLNHRDFVTPEDIHAVVHDVLRHRILLTFTAEAEGISTDEVIDALLALIAIP